MPLAADTVLLHISTPNLTLLFDYFCIIFDSLNPLWSLTNRALPKILSHLPVVACLHAVCLWDSTEPVLCHTTTLSPAGLQRLFTVHFYTKIKCCNRRLMAGQQELLPLCQNISALSCITWQQTTRGCTSWSLSFFICHYVSVCVSRTMYKQVYAPLLKTKKCSPPTYWVYSLDT